MGPSRRRGPRPLRLPTVVSAAALAALLLLAACGGSSDPSGGTGGAAGPGGDRAGEQAVGDEVSAGVPFQEDPWEPADEYQRLAAQVSADGVLDAKSALQLFALQYGELPGVPVPAGDPGPAQSGTFAVRAVLANWSALNPDTRDAVRRVLELPDGYDPAAPLPAEAPSSDDGNGGPRHPAARRDTPTAAYQTSLDQVAPALERHLGPLGATVRLETSDAVEREPTTGQQALADTLLLSDGICRIRVYPAVFPPPTGPAGTLAHELFHCYQQRWNGSPLGARAGWIQEGTAEWVTSAVMAELGGDTDRTLRAWLIEYHLTPGRALFGRTYDAFGWFAFLAERTGPLWDRLQPVVLAGTNEGAFAAATGGASDEAFNAEWASSQAGRRQWGELWALDGPGVPVLGAVDPPYRPLGNGETSGVTADGYATGLRSASLQADLTRFNALTPTVGHVRIGSSDRLLSELTGTAWCTDPDGVCTCPPGTRRAGETFPPLPGGNTAVAIGAGSQPASLTIQGISLEEECGGRGRCPVGKFKMDAVPTGQPFQVESGGTGTIVTVDESGLLTMDFSEYVPLVAASTRDPELKSYMSPAGFVTGQVTLPADGSPPVDVPIENPDGSGLAGSGRVVDRGQVVLEMTGADMRSVALAAGGAYGNALLSCLDDDTLTVSAGGIVQTYRRVP